MNRAVTTPPRLISGVVANQIGFMPEEHRRRSQQLPTKRRAIRVESVDHLVECFGAYCEWTMRHVKGICVIIPLIESEDSCRRVFTTSTFVRLLY